MHACAQDNKTLPLNFLLKSVKRIRIINNDVTKMSFKKILIRDFNEFQQHVQSIKNQYRESMILKTVWWSKHIFFNGLCHGLQIL